MQVKRRLLLVLLLIVFLAFQPVLAGQQGQKAFRWTPEASPSQGAVSEKMYESGLLIKILTAQDMTVWVTMAVNDKRLEVLLLVGNDSGLAVHVLPQDVTAQEVAKSKAFKAIPVDKVAQEMEKKARSQAGWVMAGAWWFMRNRMVTNSATQGTVTANATVMGPGGVAHGTLNGGYSESTHSVTTTPNYQAQRWAYEQGANRVQQAQAQANVLRQNGLYATTLKPKTVVAGLLFFEFDKHASEIVLRVPLNGSVYEIPFSGSEIYK